jgi:hypothetical protein
MKRAAITAVCLTVAVQTTGCRHIDDLSAIPPYASVVGATFRLRREAELLNENAFERGYNIMFDRCRGGSDDWVVAKLPVGWRVHVEAVKRQTGRMVIGSFPFERSWAVISLDDPRNPKRPIRATIEMADFANLRRADH